jgi:hypothetical protein
MMGRESTGDTGSLRAVRLHITGNCRFSGCKSQHMQEYEQTDHESRRYCVLTTGDAALMSVPRRVGLWIYAFLLAVSLFGLLFCLAIDTEWTAKGLPATTVTDFLEDLLVDSLGTLMYALPGAFLYLPIVIGLKDAEGRRIWIILISGIVIGPFSMAIWCLCFQYSLLAPAGLTILLFAIIVGSLAALFYAIALRFVYRRIKTRAVAGVTANSLL